MASVVATANESGEPKFAGFNLRERVRAGISYIPGLDGLRAISVLMVMIAHLGFGAIVPGALGVTIFFYISGFLITTLLLREIDKTGSLDFISFYMRRFLRLAPELYVFIALTWLYLHFNKVEIPTGKTFSGVLYFMNYYELFWDKQPDGTVHWGHLWSLAVEEHFYLTFPLALLALITLKKRAQSAWKLLVFIIVVGPLWRVCAILMHFPIEYTYRASDSRIDSIAYGCLFAVVIRYFDTISDWLTNRSRMLFISGLILMVFTLVMRGFWFRETIRYSLQGIALVGIFSGIYLSSYKGAILGFLEKPIFRWIGKVSYGAYLWHFILKDVLRLQFGIPDIEKVPLPGRLLWTVSGIAVTFLLTSASYYLVHNQFLALRKRWGSHATR